MTPLARPLVKVGVEWSWIDVPTVFVGDCPPTSGLRVVHGVSTLVSFFDGLRSRNERDGPSTFQSPLFIIVPARTPLLLRVPWPPVYRSRLRRSRLVQSGTRSGGGRTRGLTLLGGPEQGLVKGRRKSGAERPVHESLHNRCRWCGGVQKGAS